MEKRLKQIILEYYRYPQKFQDFQRLVFDIHEELVENDELIMKDKNAGVFVASPHENTN